MMLKYCMQYIVKEILFYTGTEAVYGQSFIHSGTESSAIAAAERIFPLAPGWGVKEINLGATRAGILKNLVLLEQMALKSKPRR